jgi:nitrilase
MMTMGMDVFVVPSAFTAKTGAAHWEVLVRSRAIENQCYAIAANQGGFHLNGRETFGNTMIVDPWGTVISKLTNGSGVVTAEVSSERIRSVRKAFPALDHVKLLKA